MVSDSSFSGSSGQKFQSSKVKFKYLFMSLGTTFTNLLQDLKKTYGIMAASAALTSFMTLQSIGFVKELIESLRCYFMMTKLLTKKAKSKAFIIIETTPPKLVLSTSPFWSKLRDTGCPNMSWFRSVCFIPILNNKKVKIL